MKLTHGSFPTHSSLQRATAALGWMSLIAACCLLGHLARLAGVPAAHLIVPILVGAGFALTGVVRQQLPKTTNRAAQAVVGVLMGSYLDPVSVAAVGASIVPLAGVTVATIALCVGVALALSKWTSMSRADAVLGMVPGGSAAIIACADDLNADSRIVAFMQYLRVGLVAATAPLVVLVINAAGEDQSAPVELATSTLDLVSSNREIAGLLALCGLCVLGIGAGRRSGLPAPALLGPMLITVVAQFTGAVDGFTPVGLLQDIAFVVVGLEVGLRFTRDSVRRIGKTFHYVLAAITVVCVSCAALAALLATMMSIPFADAYLATTPGGINAVLATAASLHAQVALVSTTQGLRLIIVVLLVPPLVRWVTRETQVAIPRPAPPPTVEIIDEHRPTLGSTGPGR